MNFFKDKAEIDTLLSSTIEYSEGIANLSLSFRKNGKIKLETTKILSISQKIIWLYIEKKYEFIAINEESEKQIEELQHIFKNAINSELSKFY